MELHDQLPLAALSDSRTLFEAGLILVLAAAAPLIAQVLRLPSILMLLALGFGAGAIGALDPNALLGETLISTIVSIAVGIILFDAGLGLNFSKLTGSVARVYRRLVSLGILVTWAVGTVAAYLLFDLSWEVALVLGAVLVVSGPTVVGPLLDFIRPSKAVNSVLKWEGTFADPIGATLGVVVFNAVIAGHATAGEEIFEFLLAIGIGAGFGIAGGVLVLAWARWFKPSQSQAVTGTLMFVVAMVVCADLLRDDTGLITGLVMGAILVNRPPQRDRARGAEDPDGKADPRLARADRHPLDLPDRGPVHHPLGPRLPASDRRDRLGEPRVHRRARVRRPPARRGALDPGLVASDARARLRRLDGAAGDRRRGDLVDVRPRPHPGRGQRGLRT